ncbi:KGG domain-containing protein [Pseudomonas sp. TWI672]|uniref:general stress protein n=1 Tax=unclassified Pseudomonas TaxID=196821 RepID=UPI003209104B
MPNNQTNRGHQGGTAQNNPGNFANDREKASEAGRKGGNTATAAVAVTVNLK